MFSVGQRVQVKDTYHCGECDDAKCPAAGHTVEILENPNKQGEYRCWSQWPFGCTEIWAKEANLQPEEDTHA